MISWSSAPPKKRTWIEKFISQPHQIFFMASIFWAIFIMSLSFAIYLGKINASFNLLHGFGLMSGVFLNAFLGFLITVIPRYSSSTSIKPKYYTAIWVGYQLAILATLFLDETLGKAFFALMLLFTAILFAFTLYKANNKTQFETLLLIGLFIIASFNILININNNTSLLWSILWLLLLPITFVVAQRMVPSFYGVYLQQTYEQVPKSLVTIAIWLFVIIGFAQELYYVKLFSVASLALLTAYILYKLPIYHKAPPILWILTVGFTWLPVGLIVMFFEVLLNANTLLLAQHILLIGYILTLLIGFGTRVILGHSGQQIIADSYTTSLFTLTQVILLVRILASIGFLGNLSFTVYLLHMGFVLWIILFIAWGLKHFKTILGKN